MSFFNTDPLKRADALLAKYGSAFDEPEAPKKGKKSSLRRDFLNLTLVEASHCKKKPPSHSTVTKTEEFSPKRFTDFGAHLSGSSMGLKTKNIRRHKNEDSSDEELSSEPNFEESKSVSLSSVSKREKQGLPVMGYIGAYEEDRLRKLRRGETVEPRKPEDSGIDVSIRIPKKKTKETHYKYGEIWGRETEGLMLCVKEGIPHHHPDKLLKIFNVYRNVIQRAGKGIGITAFMNGITVNKQTFKEYGKLLYEKMSKKTVFIGLHNDTYGAPLDVASLALKNTFPVRTPSITKMERFLKTLAYHFYVNETSIKSPVSTAIILHSEGGLVFERAFEKLDELAQKALRSHLYIIALGPVAPIPKERGISVVNIYSKRDFASLPFLASYLFEAGKYNIQFVESVSHSKEKNIFVVDHPFKTKTYQKALDAQLEILKASVGIG